MHIGDYCLLFIKVEGRRLKGFVLIPFYFHPSPFKISKEKIMKKVERNISLIRWISITQGLVFVAPVMVLYFGSRGLELSQILMLQFVFSILSMVFEFPSGYISDKLGRKKTSIAAYTVLVLAFWLFLNGNSFNTFAFAELIFALGYALISGTLSSLLYESLKALGKESEYSKVYGDINHKTLLAVAFAGISGGLIAKYLSLSATVVSTLIAFIGSFVLSLFLKEVNGANKRALKEDIKDFSLVLKSKELIGVTLFVAIIFAFNQVAFWYYQPYFKAIGVDLAYFGILFALMQVVASFGSKYANAIMHRFSKEQIFIAVAVAILVSLVGMGWFFSYFGIVFIYLQQIVRGVFMIFISEYIQKNASSELRATTVSFITLVKQLFYAANLYIFVELSKSVGLEHIYLIMAALLALLLVVFVGLKRVF